MRPYYIVAKPFAKLTIILLVIAGVMIILPAVVHKWPAVWDQLLLGNVWALISASIESLGGMVYLITAWVWLDVIRRNQ